MNEVIQISFTKDELKILIPTIKEIASQTKQIVAGLYGSGKIELKDVVEAQKTLDDLWSKFLPYEEIEQPKRSKFQQRLDDYLGK